MYRIKPIDEESTIVIADYSFESEIPPEKRDQIINTSRTLQREDFALVERQHEGVTSGAFAQGRFGPNEHAVHHFHQMIAEVLNCD